MSRQSVFWKRLLEWLDMRRIVVFVSVVMLFPTITTQAQIYIFGRADFSVGGNPTAIAAGDFNGDELPDLAVSNSGDNTISVLLAKSDSTFSQQVTYSTGPEPVAIATADFNGDSNLDLVVSNGNCTSAAGLSGPTCSPTTVSILLGRGDGTFDPHIDYSVGEFPSSIALIDLNKDGELDLAIANAFDGTLSVLLGNGDGTFRRRSSMRRLGNQVGSQWWPATSTATAILTWL
jgi:hypothetical protein